jgi:hypothetical protein
VRADGQEPNTRRERRTSGQRAAKSVSIKQGVDSAVVHGRRLNLPQEICLMLPRRLGWSKGQLIMRQKLAEGVLPGMKTPHRRTAALLTKGVPRRTAQATAGNVRGPWRLARGKALSIGLSIAYFTSIGLPKWDDGR